MLPSSKWKFEGTYGSILYGLLTVAKEWGRLPSELGICEVDENRFLMQAHSRTESLMQSWENLERKHNAK